MISSLLSSFILCVNESFKSVAEKDAQINSLSRTIDEYKIKVIISKSTDKAVKTCSKILADCIIYDRHTTSQFNEYFSKYTYNGLWFVPVSFIDDKMDVVDAINTGRTAYYITMPIDKDIVSTMLQCISKRIK